MGVWKGLHFQRRKEELKLRERERCREVTEEVGLKVQDKRAERAERSELTG